MENQSGSALNLTESTRQMALLKALSNPVRLEIVKFLHNGPSCVTLACLKLGISQPNISKHLQILKDAGIIDCRGN
ncbi:MAG: metalloregulator ArsR/SmtB family transcription factor, partial [Victivallaceae bacterium]